MVPPLLLRRTLIALVAVSWLAGCGTAGPEVTTGRLADSDSVMVAEQKDGDSFVATDGIEYRVGLVNTPELSECGGHEAADRTYELLADGFVPDRYETDQYGRAVARIVTPEGDLGVILATEGLANDRYLDDHRDEHPAYAAELDEAFTQARDRRAGLWGRCWADDLSARGTGDAPVPPATPGATPTHSGRTGEWACHRAYQECLPVGPDLDCRDVGHAVTLTGTDDPYRLDGSSTTRTDGVGCDTYDPWSPDVEYPYHRP